MITAFPKEDMDQTANKPLAAMTTAEINAVKSNVALNSDGSDTSAEQYRSSALQNIDVQERLKPEYQTIESVIHYLQSATRNSDEKKGVVNALLEASSSLSVIQKVEPTVAEEYMDDVIQALVNNENLNPWRDEILLAVRAAIEQQEKSASSDVDKLFARANTG